jgi:hypothetical protein
MNTTTTSNEAARLRKDDPALKAMNKIAKLLDPFDRTAQLKIWIGVCTQLGYLDEAERFLSQLREETK